MRNTTGVADQYALASLEARIDAALAQAGLMAAQLDWRDLTTLDHFHSRGMAATTDLADALSPERDARVLDVGCGIGGPARLLAATYGCHVTGIDLTPAVVAVATALSARTRLTDRTLFVPGDAVALPFADATFDHVLTQHAAMNIQDRARFYAEIFRVLKPGGRFAIHDVVAGERGALIFPVPWAATPEVNFLLTPAAMRTILVETGFEIQRWEDKTDITRAAMVARRPEDEQSLPLSSDVLAGPAYPVRVANFHRNLQEGRAGVVLVVAARR